MPRLEVRDIVMQFPAVRALDGVSLSFEEGEVYGIIGENGAGKSTLMRILAGLQEPTEGQILNRNAPVRFRGVSDALHQGIAMIHQELNLVDTLTVAENVFLGRESTRNGMLDRRAMSAGTARYLEQVGATFGPQEEVGNLSVAGKQLVEIAKALSYEASVLIMDEPTAVLSEREAASLFALIHTLKAKGVCVLYISHRLAEVEEICDHVSVLRDGRLVANLVRGGAGQTELANLMVGRPLGDMFPARSKPGGQESVLIAEGVADLRTVFDARVSLVPGEIVGLAGLIGSGRTEFAEMLVGARPMASGRITFEGRALNPRNPRDAARRGIVYVSEDRKGCGLVLDMTVVENTTLANLDAYAKPFLRKNAERLSAEGWREKLDIRAGDMNAPILFLSGGNQQKVAIAKWLEMSPKVLILDEPTRGVDVGAKREIYALIHDLAQEGLACLVISSELPELLGLCHRIVVMREGKIVGELPAEGATEEAVMQMAAGVRAA